MTRTEIFLLVWALVLAMYALYSAVFLPRDLWVSYTMLRLGKAYPIIPFALGILLAHWFWS